MSISDPTQLPADQRYQCRACGFNLTGLIIEGGKLTCPECGRSGSLGYVAEAEPPAPPPILRTFWRMCRWTTLLLIVTTGCGLMSNFVGDEFAALAGFTGLAAALAGVLAPLMVASDITAHHVREQRRRAAILSLVISGVGLNIAQAALLMIGALIIVVILNPP